MTINMPPSGASPATVTSKRTPPPVLQKSVESVAASADVPDIEQAQSASSQDIAQAADKLKEQVEQAARQLREAIRIRQSSLEFEVEEPDNRVVITVRDRDTQEVVRQIPSEEALRISRALEQDSSGVDSMLISGKV